MLLSRATVLFAKMRSADSRLVPIFQRSLITKDSTIAERDAEKLLDKLYKEVVAQRFNDIVVIQTKFNANPRYYVLANAFNSRHLLNGTELLNKQFKIDMKLEADEFAKLSISREWNVLDFNAVIIHLFSEDCREHFDIEQLWAVGEQYDSKCRQGRLVQQQQQQQPQDEPLQQLKYHD